MNNYTVNFCIIDRCCINGSSNTLQKEVNVTDINTTILLHNNYTLNILSVNENYCSVIIQDGINTYILNIYTTFATELCVCNTNNSSHKLSISCTITEI